MAKAKLVQYEHNGTVFKEQIHIMCPGCGYTHAMSLQVHRFNGDYDKPTFTPSLLCDWSPGRRCHSFVTHGKIEFLNDCDHSLKGQTVDLPDIE